MKTTLPSEEWDFSSLSSSRWDGAWRWEWQRQINIDFPTLNTPKLKKFHEFFTRPFMLLPELDKERLCREMGDKLGLSLDEFDPRGGLCPDSEFYNGTSNFLMHSFRIDWTASKTKMVQDFERWLEDSHHLYHGKVKGSKAGRRPDPFKWLADLAIYRLSKHGHTLREVEQLLGWIKSRRSTAFKASHFSDARRNIRNRLSDHKAEEDHERVRKKNSQQNIKAARLAMMVDPFQRIKTK